MKAFRVTVASVPMIIAYVKAQDSCPYDPIPFPTWKCPSLTCALRNPSTGVQISGYDLDNLGEYAGDLADNGTCSVDGPYQNCIRVSCGNTTGIWMCNQNEDGSTASANCADIAMYASAGNGKASPETIGANCVDDGGNSGETFDTRGFSVVAAYANCNLDPNLNMYQQ